MEGSVLSPTSWEKRRAWLRQSRHWQTQVLEEEAAAALQDVPDPEPSSLDDVFQEGNPITKIEDWLQDCGYSEEGFFEEVGHSIYNGCPSHGTSFEDDLTLGAEATLLATNGKLFSRSFLETARPYQLLDLGCSLASSSMTGGTNKTSSSISEILDKVQEDAEDVLFSLGFGQEDHKDTSRIPARFFANPSQARGIDFQLFLKAQVQRIEMEDPCLMLASRFKQVQTLAVTADAFFCLYSYVSKTPVQKFTPSHMFWNCNPTDVPSIKILAPEPELHSPRERLRKAISKMCLYTCPRVRLSPPHHTPKRNSLDQVVWEVMDRVRGEKLVLHQDPEFGPGSQKGPVHPIRGTTLPTSSCSCDLCPKEETQQGMSTEHAPSQILYSNPKTPCCTHSMPRADLQLSTEPAQVKREWWGLQATNKEVHLVKDETFWQRKSKARKSLFQNNPTVRKVKSLDLSIIQQKWKQSQQRPALHRSLTQQLRDTFDLEEVQSNSEEEETRWASRPRPPDLYQTLTGKDTRSFLHHHNSTCSDSSGFIEEPNSHLFLQEVVLPPISSSCSQALQTPELSREKAAWYAEKQSRLRDLESTS
ncbi:protein TESPA1 isoform X1 [Molossus molossus]|uniref:Thymocyte expressed, positive selection associated 1 n=1 Tax=Molossus molossus TaxID=27622 RepID=A0A7J8G303_MOLMO|nr:protein TESPA1 isoform X1 [Molossus molossus]XP_036107248.1 protein TESPA1 isoform X1 [Molossus molossus]XP_036107249.1 protein TESPA1 isoform X1 [Molossus molossus]XP_036107250.1 protein TESPA1 isoform X1 [Molossus molossus]XP_036107251.1 protein TESPA1 isoform X1 [Molossus molossus]KAF6454039.1 thymocyte expressed, positive selection associated 1 [Molossus molossus]